MCERSCGIEQCSARVGSSKQLGYLLIGHGTRNVEGTEEFLTLGRMLQQRLAPSPVHACFLELQSPTIAEAWKLLIRQQVDGVVAMPLLLFAAGHAKRDIPEALEAACSESKRDICFMQTPPLACHPKLLELSSFRALQSIEASANHACDIARTALVMVGRGSLDGHATAEMFRFSELRGQTLRPAVLRTGFVAMAKPKLSEVLEEVGKLQDIETVIVQPHLLFQGDLNQRIEAIVDQAAARFTDRCWIKTGRIGPHEMLVDAVVQIADDQMAAKLPRASECL